MFAQAAMDRRGVTVLWLLVMTLPFTLPDWVPWWVPLALLVPALLYALALILMPFSVFGVKSRLDAIEARLDEIQGEIRSLSLRMPEPLRAASADPYEDIYAAPPIARGDAPNPGTRVEPSFARPPIPPASHDLHDYDQPDDAYRRDRLGARGREEPRLGRPR